MVLVQKSKKDTGIEYMAKSQRDHLLKLNFKYEILKLVTSSKCDQYDQYDHYHHYDQ